MMSFKEYRDESLKTMKRRPTLWEGYEVFFGCGGDTIITMMKAPRQDYRWHYTRNVSSRVPGQPEMYLDYLRDTSMSNSFKTMGAALADMAETTATGLPEALEDLRKQLQ
jgi:hypothetical protein